MPLLNKNIDKSQQFIALVVAVVLSTDASAAVVVDFSPDTTGKAYASAFLVNEVNSLPLQILGDRFTLASTTTITGGSTFGSSSVPDRAGGAVRFLIFSDTAGTPGPVLFDIGAVVDAFDSVLTLSQPDLARSHTTISPISLAAGTYWFAMPGDGFAMAQANTRPGYDDGALWLTVFSPAYPPATLTQHRPEGGDLFFTLEGTVETAAVPEPASLLAWANFALLSLATSVRLAIGDRVKILRGALAGIVGKVFGLTPNDQCILALDGLAPGVNFVIGRDALTLDAAPSQPK